GGRLDEQVLVVEDLAGLPERLVLLVFECNVDRSVGADRRDRELVLVASTGWPGLLEGAERRIRARDLVRRRPGEAAVIRVRLEDRRGEVVAPCRYEFCPGQVRVPVK